MREIPPYKGAPYERAAQKWGAYRLQERWVPQLQKFEDTGDDENTDGDYICGTFWREKEEGQQDPENLIKQASAIVIEPPITGPRIQFEGETEGGDDQERKNYTSIEH